MLPLRAIAVAGLIAAAAPLALAQGEPLAWADVDTGPVPADLHAEAVPDYQVFVDGAIREAGESGAPVRQEDGSPAIDAAGATVVLDPAARPGGVIADASAPASVLADGWTLPAGTPLQDIRISGGLASGDRDLLRLTAPEERAPARATVAAVTPTSDATSAPASGGAASLARPASSPTSTPADRTTYHPKPVSSAKAPSYTPSAVALAPASTTNAGTVAAASAVAIGALLALWPLYHRLRGAETLESATRKRVYDVVCTRAGAGVAEVALKAGVSYSTATYHLDRLVEAGMLVASDEGAKLRYYKNGTLNEADRKLVPLLENAEVMRLLTLIRENPGTYRAALADALNVTTTTINWHLKRLTQAGLVREERKGRSAHLYAVEERLAGLPALGARLAVTTDDGVATN